jgi:hypothetical protein
MLSPHHGTLATSIAKTKSLLLNRKINTSPTSLDDKDTLKKFLTTPPVKKIDLHFPLGLEVTARNLKGVTIKDALDAIYKQYKKKVCPVHHCTPLSRSQAFCHSSRLTPVTSIQLD